ncbi:hypothetical protein HF313_17595 [Massilia atriviolacea]|uniref:CDP-diacylglycerol--serine O-phosphatidyltransferase n=1 Tax=Massilia atriviolacea TaxID=2495579 RepID=A0A430HTN4_9BURK|nr:CDP-alcohol phosphatidyltransferase family protein [Massilia atriviolacea]RSZ60897.1 hypothetical protein EJB06_01805 [Massilia atriviolacea]
MLVIAYLNLPNAITLIGMLFALASISLALQGALAFSLAALLLAGVCDLLDGAVARRTARTEQQRQFGQALDSLVDVLSFGVAPCAFLYALQGTPSYSLHVCAFLYLAAAVLRLSYFSVHGLAEEAAGKGNGKYYTGMPVTYAAFLLPASVALASLLPWQAGWEWLGCAWLLAVGSLFVSRMPFKKPSGKAYAGCLLVLLGLCGALVYRGSVA